MQNSIFFTILQSWKKKSLPSKFQFTEFQHKQFINVSFCVWTASKKTQFYSKKVKLLNFLKKIYIFGFTFIIGKNFLTKLWILTSKYILPRNDLSLHCTDFFLETKNRSYCLHVLEEVELQMEVKMRSGGGEPLGEPLLTSSRPPMDSTTYKCFIKQISLFSDFGS